MRRNDPLRLQIAAHELGHAFVWLNQGLQVSAVVAKGEDSYVDVKWDKTRARGYCIGCWGGYEAERLWLQWHGGGDPDLDNSAHDIANFTHVAQQLDEPLTVAVAQLLAAATLIRHWQRIEDLVPELVRLGRLVHLL